MSNLQPRYNPSTLIPRRRRWQLKLHGLRGLRAILSGCPPHGIVLDPFAGSGTTVLTAVKNGREGIGFDLNPEYTDMRFDHIQAEQAKIPIPFVEYAPAEQETLNL